MTTAELEKYEAQRRALVAAYDFEENTVLPPLRGSKARLFDALERLTEAQKALDEEQRIRAIAYQVIDDTLIEERARKKKGKK